MLRKTPQEKKELSYAKDRRNAYGENDKSSRKSICQSKRLPNRADRRQEHQVLTSVSGPVISSVAEEAEQRVASRRSKWLTRGWRKDPDQPLAEYVEARLHRRVELGIDHPATAEDRIARVRFRSRRLRR